MQNEADKLNRQKYIENKLLFYLILIEPVISESKTRDPD